VDYHISLRISRSSIVVGIFSKRGWFEFIIYLSKYFFNWNYL